MQYETTKVSRAIYYISFSTQPRVVSDAIVKLIYITQPLVASFSTQPRVVSDAMTCIAKDETVETSFSTQPRVVSDAIDRGSGHKNADRNFQYSTTSRKRCNEQLWREELAALRNFQYSTTSRKRCNPALPNGTRPTFPPRICRVAAPGASWHVLILAYSPPFWG